MNEDSHFRSNARREGIRSEKAAKVFIFVVSATLLGLVLPVLDEVVYLPKPCDNSEPSRVATSASELVHDQQRTFVRAICQVMTNRFFSGA